MYRRELLKLISATTGTAMIGGATLLSGCATSAPKTFVFSQNDVLLLDEIAETILPRTETPGAKDAQVGQFMTVYVTDCYTLDEQATFHKGLVALEERCNSVYNRNFMSLQPAERQSFIGALDQEARVHAVNSKGKGEMHYFTMIKQLTIFGFFTSEVGGTQVLRHAPIPGRYDGELPYKKGDRAWATT